MNSYNVSLTPQSGDGFRGYVAVPERPNGGGIVVLQEIFGINLNIRAVANRFAKAGFFAIAPDLFWRQEAGVELEPTSEKDRERAMRLMQGLDQSLAVSDALIAADYIRSLPGANGKVGVVGYCLGGKLAYLLAMEPRISAAVSYYGVAIQGALDRIQEVEAPLLLHIAEEDNLCPPEAQAAIEQAAAASESIITVMRHPEVGHAFARLASPAYVAVAAERADAATHEFLLANLAGVP